MNCLLARRLLEHGVPCVKITHRDYDTHFENFNHHLEQLREFDRPFATLVGDMAERGMLENTLVICMSEFGRTPKINKSAGRDHWPNVACALLAGGGMPVGQVIGRTNDLAEEPIDRPIHFQEVFATIYRNLGIDIARTTITDLSGRPNYLVDGYQPIAELT